MDNNRIAVLFTVFSLLIAGCSVSKSASNTQAHNDNDTTGSSIMLYSVQPAGAYAGTAIVITGTGFGADKGTVTFGDTEGAINSWSDTSINVVVPDITAGLININVVSGTKTGSIDFTILPFISGISTQDAVLNDPMDIQGTGFGTSQGDYTVNYAGTVLPVTAWSNDRITVAIGNITHAAAGLLNVLINNTVSNGITLTVHPSISSLYPDTAERGDEISIAGNLFGPNNGTNSVTFSGMTATVISWSDDIIKAKVPVTAVKGDVIVTVNDIPSSGQGFTVTGTFHSINQPAGLAEDLSGNMYVANYTDGTIIKVLPGGITQTTVFKGLSKPMGLYYRQPSTLYVACEGDGTIQRLTLDSTVTGQTFASGFSMPAAMAIDDAGNMYVANYGNNTISKIDLSGAVSTFAVGLNKPMGIVFTGPTGGKTFKVINNGNGTISSVDLLGAVTAYVTGLDTPKWVIADNAYNLYVASGNNIIKVLSPSGFIVTYATGLFNPYGLVMDLSGYIYASNFDTNTIAKVDNNYQIYAKGLYNPWGITFSPSGTMFIANQGDIYGMGGGSISMVTTGGVEKPFVKPFDRSVCKSSIFLSTKPMGIIFGFNGNIFVANNGNGRLEATSISEVTGTGNAQVYGDCFLYRFVQSLCGISFSSGTGLLYVSDPLSGKVFTLTSNPSKIYSFASGFNSPEGIAIDSSGNAYIANAGNGTISQTTSSGTFTTTYASGFNQPSGIAFDRIGNLYVSNYASNSVSLITTGRQTYTIATGIQEPNGIAVDNAGYVYVASETTGNVYKLTHSAVVYASGFNAPKNLAKGIDGLIYIADSSNNAVYRIDAADVLTTFAHNITSPSWFVFDSTGDMFLSDFSTSTIIKSLNDSLTTFATSLNGPTGIAYDSLNNLLYVVNYLNGTLSVVNSFGSVSTFAVGLSGPMGLALLSPGNLYAANSSNGTIAKVVQGSGVSVYATGFVMPIGVTLDDQYNLFVADQAAGFVYLISPDRKVFSFAKISTPYGISFDGNGNLFISDTMHKQIKMIILH